MLNSWGTMLTVALSEQGLIVHRSVRSWRAPFAAPSVETLADVRLPGTDTWSVEALAAQCAAVLADVRCKGLRTRVTLADALVRYLLVVPPQNAASLADCRAAADMRFQALYGLSAAEWTLRADWQARRPFLACAMPAALLRALEAAAAEHGLALLHVTPRFVDVWNRFGRACKPGDWVAALDGPAATVGIAGRHGIAAVRRVRAPGTVDADAWDGLVRQEALLLDVAAPRRLRLVDAEDTASDLEFDVTEAAA